MLFSSQEIY